MAKNSSKNPQFIKKLLPDYLCNFSIPQTFFDKYLRVPKENEDKMGILRDKSKKLWYVKISNDGRHFNKTGWEEFCEDHNLQVGYLLLFILDKNLVFDVIIMDSNGCESHHFQSTPTIVSDDVPGVEDFGYVEEENIESPVKVFSNFKPSSHRPYFQFTVKPSNLKNGVIRLPLEFARENGLQNRWCNCKLRDVNGKLSKMKYRCKKAIDDEDARNHYIFCKASFYKVHAIQEEDLLIIELLDNGATPVFNFYTQDK